VEGDPEEMRHESIEAERLRAAAGGAE